MSLGLGEIDVAISNGMVQDTSVKSHRRPAHKTLKSEEKKEKKKKARKSPRGQNPINSRFQASSQLTIILPPLFSVPGFFFFFLPTYLLPYPRCSTRLGDGDTESGALIKRVRFMYRISPARASLCSRRIGTCFGATLL
ncbi:hypothetical protein P280DRAFT_35525 [Massarina eburnea CBS 473.64]|uniref:Uncharacterized protein n=1 Tax=Massarina eburnea CBS 473.64 TaxID=1395130 RepID=A0A6A6S1V5_9PLEO|nr:hypothetical protein P280DRAFT_35525 [Massarina eburnea CBS 473.64]